MANSGLGLGRRLLVGVDFSHASARTRDLFARDFVLCADYLAPDEEASLVGAARQALRKADWHQGHFDNVILDYRETVRRNLAPYPALARVFERVRQDWFPPGAQLAEAHVLELAPTGYIKPHIDNYCGEYIAGLSLVRPARIRFQLAADRSDHVVVAVPPRSIYRQRGAIRYEYEHSVEQDAPESVPGPPSGLPGRISIMFRQQA